MFSLRLIRTVNFKFKKFSAAALTVDDIYDPPEYKIIPISLDPPICPICNEFIDNNKKDCKFEIIDGSCPLKVYNRNKEAIKKLVDKIKK
jgi:hypothetical protein